ncbi:MAG: hypothetical protein JXR48_10820 [Candidatus Delongbacteria bacterium]|nr:hypothetical protein [Candidatus Delongbacteria bacterium]MBN2835445.1 hypothetical protein [Candidatus Delongbacteria bacterium]
MRDELVKIGRFDFLNPKCKNCEECCGKMISFTSERVFFILPCLEQEKLFYFPVQEFMQKFNSAVKII